MFDADQVALEAAVAIAQIDPGKLPGGMNQALAQTQCLILDAMQAATAGAELEKRK